MLARLGRVIYWFCCGVAALLAIAPIVVHGLPLLEKSPPPLADLEKASIKVVSQDAKKIEYRVELTGNRNFEVNYDFDGPWVEHQRAEVEKHGGMFDDLIPEKRLPLLEEARRRGLLTTEQKAELDKARQITALNKIRTLIENDHARRASLWSVFSQIVPLSLIGALMIFLLGRGIRYVLSNE